MNAEVLAVGTELLLGQVVDTNSAWLGEQLALAGIDSHLQVKVGDNHARIVAALRGALGRAAAVIVCGGLGPTHDDITREAIAEVMGVALVVEPALASRIAAMFAERGRTMSSNNARQAQVPVGARAITQVRGTAPGLICPVGDKVVYALPGVPAEMREMALRAVIPDLVARAGPASVIASRVLRIWGLAESAVAETLAGRISALEGVVGGVTVALLASVSKGIRVRLTLRAHDLPAAGLLLDSEEARMRALLGENVFGVDDQTMEDAVGALLVGRGLTVGLAESVTGGMVASRLVGVPGASQWFRGSVVAYSASVKRSVLRVAPGPVVSAEAAMEMAAGARAVLGADIGVGVTGVAGPTVDEGVAVGTVFWGIAGPGAVAGSGGLDLRGDREQVRRAATMSVLDLLRRHLLSTSRE
ncbi:MAG: competence/damage-inducible protein A [Acidimicrobiales bacterium]